MRSKPRAFQAEPEGEMPEPAPQASASPAHTDWRFQYFRKKHLVRLARLLACRVEDLMDAHDEGVPLGTAYGENLAKRLRLLYRWTPERIEQTLSNLKRMH
jgi:hypothetical protein